MPLQTFKEHQGAVKAIAWSPHQRSLLASGGGSADCSIRIWSSLQLEPVQRVDTGSQVCNLVWSKHTNELVSDSRYTLDTLSPLAVWLIAVFFAIQNGIWKAFKKYCELSESLACHDDFFFFCLILFVSRSAPTVTQIIKWWCGSVHHSLRWPASLITQTESSTWSVSVCQCLSCPSLSSSFSCGSLHDVTSSSSSGHVSRWGGDSDRGRRERWDPLLLETF